MSNDTPTFRRKIRSFVLRTGRMTAGQQRAYDDHWERIGINYADYCDQATDPQTLFASEQPITLEIGFGMGDSLADMALANPDKNFIGIEVHRPGVGKLLQRVERDELRNLRIFEYDAIEVLERCIPVDSLSEVLIFFPDPWHKKKTP